MKGKQSSASAWLADLITHLSGCRRRPDGQWMSMCAHGRLDDVVCLSVSIEADGGPWHFEGHLIFTLVVCNISMTPFKPNECLEMWAVHSGSFRTYHLLLMELSEGYFRGQKTEFIEKSKHVTSECLCAGVDSCQTLRGAKIWDLQDPAVGIHQHIITLHD